MMTSKTLAPESVAPLNHRAVEDWKPSAIWRHPPATTAISILLFVLSNSAATAATYQVVDTGTLGGSTSTGWAINASGTVVGTSNVAGNNTNFDKAFKYSATGMTNLGTLGGFLSEARDINSSGSVTGWSTSSSFGSSQAYLYSGGTMKGLGTLGGSLSYGYGINDGGFVTGTSYTASGQERAFLWNGAQMISLGTLGGSYSNGRKLNSQNSVVGVSGNSTLALTYHGFLHRNGTMQDIGTLGGLLSSAYDLNINDQVVGWSTIPSSNNIVHAFLYQSGTMLDLGTLGGTYSYAFGINDRSQVVGQSYTFGDSSQRGFLYEDGVMYDLNDLLDQSSGQGWTITDAWDINEAGQIVANGSRNGGPSHALLLAPIASVAEPTTLFLFTAGGLLILLSSTKRNSMSARK